MKELSLNVLDITKNSVKAGATRIEILLTETENTLTLQILDNGCGMSEETLARVTDPFYTTRTTRKVGLGVPLLKLAAEQTGGTVTVSSSTADADHGTAVTATFDKTHLDFTPLGDMVPTVTTLIQGAPEIDFHFRHEMPGRTVEMDTAELREVLGDVSLSEYEVLRWIEEYLYEQYRA